MIVNTIPFYHVTGRLACVTYQKISFAQDVFKDFKKEEQTQN
jgi:hypothetical protein